MKTRIRLPLTMFPIRCRLVAVSALAITCLASINLRAQTDNFDTGNDNGWAKVTNSLYPAVYSFPTDGFGGYSYRLQGAQSLDSSGARVIAYRPDRLYTNFYVAADMVAWDGLNVTNDQVFGVFGRGNNLDSGNMDAVTLTTRINRFSSSDGPKGQVQIYSISGGNVGRGVAQTVFTALVPGRQYRFILTGVGDFYTAAVYDLEDLTRPLISMSGDGSNAADFGIPIPSSGYVGIFNLSLASGSRDPTTDTTFDNFVAAELPPASVTPPATPHGLVSAPQVKNRTPASFANFCSAAGGVTFNATTLSTTNSINAAAIRLYLNGVDVSPSLSISGPATNLLVSYNNLASNAVYDARIELQDALGRRTTNSFAFDTFADAYLATAPAKCIECEDYDYTDGVNDGLFINDPIPSGLTTNGSPVNTGGGGYYGLTGSNARTNGLDFYTPDSAADSTWNSFRTSDPINSLQGDINYGYVYQDNVGYFDFQLFNRSYDTQRQKYANADFALEEYGVLHTKGGTWMNYTRIFPTNSYYNIYLRHACSLTQGLSLDQIVPGTITNNLGTFGATNALAMNNYRYAPLRDSAGNLAVVNLSGTNIIRLTIAPPDLGSTRYGLTLNYLALVPALLLESAAQASGPYQIETTASVEPGTRQVTVPKSGSTRFYRLSWDHAVRITSIRLSGGNVLLSYQ